MEQQWKHYTQEDHSVWSILFSRQITQLTLYACPEYLNCLEELHTVFNATQIPVMLSLSDSIKSRTGWEIKIVPGLIPAREFLSLLSQKVFCSSTWLRTRAQLNYLEEPDMFHDLFGHVPLLIDPAYARFMEKLGQLSLLYNQDHQIALLERLYWYTVEFGLIENEHGRQVYGSGILSSYGETKSVMQVNSPVLRFNLDQVLDAGFTKDQMQSQYFSIDSLTELNAMIPALEEKLLRESINIESSMAYS